MVKVNKVRIKNYKSINDSGDIIIGDRITVLAGKNESGKTNILKALDTYYKDDFSVEDVPTKDSELNPTIIVDFSIPGSYFNNCIGREWLVNENEYTYSIERSKNIKDKFSGRLFDEISRNTKLEIENIKEEFVENLNKISSMLNIELDMQKATKEIFNIYIDSLLDVENLDSNTERRILSIFGIDGKIKPEIKPELNKIVAKIKATEIFEVISQICNIIIPEFKYFDNFDDMIPDEIDILELKKPDFEKKYRGVVNLLALFNKSIAEFAKEMEEISRAPQTKLDMYSKNITLEYQDIYKQEKLKISLNKDGNKIYINIYDIDDLINPKKPSQRSKGLQWFLSFYLMLNNSTKNSILLIDEPGLYLHASAQEDILKFFEKKLDNIILYTTHSPYLIDTNNMARIKLVTNDRNKGKGTVVENKYYNCSDLETITPIITAIGYNVSRSPLELGGGLNVITEGVSDRYYILAFLKLFGIQDIIHIIPSQGARVIYLLASIAIGWKLNYIILIDTDQGKDDAKEKLRDFYANNEEYNSYVYDVINKENSCIEDVFSQEDKKKFSIKGGKKNKLINAKRFFDAVQEGNITIDDLSDETKVNIEYIIDILKKNV